MQMVDRQGNTIEVPDDKAQEAFTSGQYGFAPGTRIPVRSSEGLGTVAAEDYNPTLPIASQQELNAATQEAKYGGFGGEAAAFGIGAGDALTLGFGKGLATKAAGAIGGPEAEERTREAIRGYSETNPKSEFAGQIAGTVAPLALGGIEGVVGSGARGLGSGVRAADALGTLAETGVRGIVGEGAGGALARAGQKALAYGARGAAEGSLFGTGGAYSEAVLDNEDLTAERLMSGAAHGALMGGAIGGGLGAGAKLAGRAVNKVAEAVVPTIREAVEGFAERQAFKAAGGSKAWAEEALERAGGADEVSRDLLARGHVTYDATPTSIAQSVAKDADETGQKLGSMMRDIDAKAVAEGAPLIDGSKLIERSYNEVVTPLLNNPATRDVGEQAAKRLEPFVEDFAGKEIGHSKLWEIGKALDARLDAAGAGNPELTKALQDFHGVMHEEMLESADRAAKATGMGDAFAKDWKETERLYQSLNFAKEMTGDAIAGKQALSFGDKLAGGLGAMATGHAAEGLGHGIGHGLGILSLLHPQAALSAVLTAAAHKVLRERGSSILATAANRLAKVGAVADHAIGVDQQVSQAVDKFLSKGTATAAKVAAENPDRIGAQGAGVAGAAAKIFGGRPGEGKTPKSLDGKFHEATRAVATLASQPEAASAHMQKTLGPLIQNSPVMALKVSQLQSKALSFLQSKLPPQAAAAPLSTMPQKGVPDTSKASFLRTLRAVQHPLSVVDDLEKGQLSKEGVEALKATKPEMYQDLREKVLGRVNELAAEGHDVPYQQKLQIGRLFGTPVDPTQSPEFTKAIGEVFAQMNSDTAKPPDQGGAAAGPSGGGSSGGGGGGGAPSRKVDTAGALETRTTALEKGLG